MMVLLATASYPFQSHTHPVVAGVKIESLAASTANKDCNIPPLTRVSFLPDVDSREERLSGGLLGFS